VTIGKAFIGSLMIAVLFVLGMCSAGCTDENRSTAFSANTSQDVRKEILKLQSNDPMDRVNGARTSGSMKSRAAPAIPFLIELLNDNRIAKSLSDRIWDTVSLGGAGVGVRNTAIQALVDIGDSTIDPLIDALRDTRPRIRAGAAIAFGNLALRGIKAHRAAPALIKSLQDQDAMARVWAATALGNIGDTAATEALITCLRDNDPEVRGAAARSLGNLRDPRAIKPLIDMLRRGEPNSGHAEWSLRMLTGESLGSDYHNWEDWVNKNRKNTK
jgi:HEAT repeat protein